jgi:hypothetical protein
MIQPASQGKPDLDCRAGQLVQVSVPLDGGNFLDRTILGFRHWLF